MANRDAPYGFKPVARLDGSQIPVKRFSVYSSQADGIYVGDVMKALATGNVEAANAGDGAAVLGVCVGIQDTNGEAVGSPNSSVSTKYLAASTGGYALIALALPDSVFQAQSSGSLDATDVFASVDHVATAGDTITARSRHELNSSTSTSAQFKILGKVEEPGNDWGTNVELLVVAGEGYWFTGAAGI